MLESLVAQYMYLSRSTRLAIKLSVFIFGGVLSCLRQERTFELSPRPYFAIVSVSILLLFLSAFLSTFLLNAMKRNIVWILALADALSWLISGFVLGVGSAARSRNIFGHSKGAVLAFIPPAILYLIYQRPRDNAQRSKYLWIKQLEGGKGIAIILVTLGGAFFSYAASKESESYIANYLHDTPKIERVVTRYAIRGLGLHGALKRHASEYEFPKKKERGKLEDVSAVGTKLIFSYTVPSSVTSISEKTPVFEHRCTDPETRILLRHGAIFEFLYNTMDGRTLTLRIDQETCENFNQG